MKHPNLSNLLLAFVLSISCVGATAQDQAQLPPGSPAVPKSDSQWLVLSRQITELSNKYAFYKDDDDGKSWTKPQRDAFEVVNKLEEELRDLPTEQTILAYRYMVEHATDKEFLWRSAGGLYNIPTPETVSYTLPIFKKMSARDKFLWLRDSEDYVLLYPEVPQYREFPRFALEQAAQAKPRAPRKSATPRELSDQQLYEQGLISQSAGALTTVATDKDKQLMHQALARDYENSGLWGALTQLNDISPAEAQKARELLPFYKDNPVARLMFAAALSPGDAQMSALVKNAMEAEFKAKANIKVAPENDKAKQEPQMLMFLRVWDLKLAKPYLYRCLHAPNPQLRGLAMFVLALRSPQDVLRVAAAKPDAVQSDDLLSAAIALIWLNHPQLRARAVQVSISEIDKRSRELDGEDAWNAENEERVKEGFVETLRGGSIKSAFFEYAIVEYTDF